MPCRRLEYPFSLGLFSDAGGTNLPVDGLQFLFDACRPRRQSADGAPLVWRHNGQNIATPLAASEQWRAKALELGFDIVNTAAPFNPQSPGHPFQGPTLIANWPTYINAYEADDPIFVAANHNDDSWAGTDAEWFAIEGPLLKICQDMNVRHAVHDDKGVTWLCGNIAERAQAWADAGVDINRLEFIGVHSYVHAGWVPVLIEMAQASLARAGVFRPIWMIELAWDFVHSNAQPPLNTRAGRPDLFTSPATDWTRLVFRWMRDRGIPACFFDFPMLFDDEEVLSPLGEIFVEEAQQQVAWTSPSPAASLALMTSTEITSAAQKAYSIAKSNRGAMSEEDKEALGQAAGAWIASGQFWDLPPAE